MQSRRFCPLIYTIQLALVMAIMPVVAHAQVLTVDEERLEDWFYSMLVWGVVLGIIFGAIVGIFDLCRLKYPIDSLHINGVARRKFGLWLLVVFVMGAILLLLDAWLLYPFTDITLSFSEALVQVWLNYRTILVLLLAVLTFSATVAITTRITPGSHCPYAFIPGPKGR
jgi:H+/Cl- antiporter ClcA